MPDCLDRTLDAYFHERDRHVIYIDASLSAMAFMLALETLGLSSCCINWPNLQDKETAVAKMLGLRPYENVVILIAIGYPMAESLIPASDKKSLPEIRAYNKR